MFLQACGPRISPLPPVRDGQQKPVETVDSQLSRKPQVVRNERAVGILLPLSGSRAAIGKNFLQAIELSLFENASEQVQLIIKDTKSTVSGAQQAAQEAINDQAQILLGPIFSDEVQAAANVAVKNKVNLISFSNNKAVSKTGVYIMGFSPSEQVKRVLDYAHQRGINTIVFMRPESPYGHLISGVIKEYQSTHSVNIKEIPYKADGSDIPVAVQKLKDMSFDGLFIPSGGQELEKIATAILFYDIDMAGKKILGTGQWDTPQIHRNKMLHGAWFAASNPLERQEFEQNFMKEHQTKPLRISTLGYDGMSLIAALLRLNSQAPFVSSSLAEPRGFAGIDGVFRLRINGQVERKLAILEVTPRGVEVIDAPSSRF